MAENKEITKEIKNITRITILIETDDGRVINEKFYDIDKFTYSILKKEELLDKMGKNIKNNFKSIKQKVGKEYDEFSNKISGGFSKFSELSTGISLFSKTL